MPIACFVKRNVPYLGMINVHNIHLINCTLLLHKPNQEELYHWTLETNFLELKTKGRRTTRMPKILQFTVSNEVLVFLIKKVFTLVFWLLLEGYRYGSGSVHIVVDSDTGAPKTGSVHIVVDSDTGAPKTYGSGSGTLLKTFLMFVVKVRWNFFQRFLFSNLP
jgi:hypothetical protein